MQIDTRIGQRLAANLGLVVMLIGLPGGAGAATSSVSASTPLGNFAARGAVPLSGPVVNIGDTLTKPECPLALMSRCHVDMAAYAQDDPNDKSNYGDYDLANRPAGGLTSQPGVSLPITMIVQHDTEGSLADTLAQFKDPTTYVSAHYVIDTDGSVYQMVPDKDVAWHAGNWYVNMHAIGIEEVGTAADGGKGFTPAMYQSTMLLEEWLAAKYHIALDRQHLLGHDNVPAPTQALVAGMHWDPGPFWNWQLQLAMMGRVVAPTAGSGSPLVTVAPNWATNRPVVTDCSSGTCVALPAQPANFVYLHSAPSAGAPLVSDPALHPDGSTGTTAIDDWSARAVYGQQFAVAGRQDGWTGVYYGGANADGTVKIGWLQDSLSQPVTVPSRGQYVTPKAGRTSISVYGRAYPEAAAYAGSLATQQAVVPLDYTIGAGERYATTGPVPTDYYWTWYIDNTFNRSDHTVVVGQTVYLEIQFNDRVAYVNAADVDVHTAR